MLNNPLRYTDPSGHNPATAIAIAVGFGILSGSIGAALGYLTGIWVTGGEFDNISFGVATIGGGIAGGLTVGAAIGSPMTANITTPAINGTMLSLQYAVDKKLHGDDLNDLNDLDVDNINTLALHFAFGALVSPIGGTYSSGFLMGGKKAALEFGKQYIFQGAKDAAEIFIAEESFSLVVTSIRNYIANTLSTATSNAYGDVFKKNPNSKFEYGVE